MEQLSLALIIGGALKSFFKSDFIEKMEGLYYFVIGSLLFTTQRFSEVSLENASLIISLFALLLLAQFALVLPYIEGAKNRNMEDLDDLDD